MQSPAWWPRRLWLATAAAVAALGPEMALAEGPGPFVVRTPLDHFDPLETRDWEQPFYVNDTFWAGPASGAPIFLCMGGEGPPIDASVVVNSVHCNNAVEWLPETGALLIVLEHRFYTCHDMARCPVKALDSVKAFRFLSVHQALADAANLHRHIVAHYNLTSRNKWITFGGSYPGMVAAWARLKYPHLFFASVASSAPVQAQLDMGGYNDVVASAFEEPLVGGSVACRERIAEGHRQVGELLQSKAGRAQLENDFSLEAGALASEQARRFFAGSGVAMFPAQANDPACPQPVCNIRKICRFILDAHGDALQALAALRRTQGLSAQLQRPQPSFGKALGLDDMWNWQACTEFGFLQTCEVGSHCMFTQGLQTVEASFADQCRGFGLTEVSALQMRIQETNLAFGGNQTAASRIMWVNGSVDPWIALSVRQLPRGGAGQALFTAAGASHHAWTHPSSPTDQASVKEARRAIRTTVLDWLKQEHRVEAAVRQEASE